MDVVILQSSKEEAAIELYELLDDQSETAILSGAEWIFPSGIHGDDRLMARTLKGYWTPATKNLMFDSGAGFNWSAESQNTFLTAYEDGETPAIVVLPALMSKEMLETDLFPEQETELKFAVWGEEVEASLKIKQVHYDVYGYPDEAGYTMDGSEYSFEVKSNRM